MDDRDSFSIKSDNDIKNEKDGINKKIKSEEIHSKKENKREYTYD